jgi:hypothetical protein
MPALKYHKSARFEIFLKIVGRRTQDGISDQTKRHRIVVGNFNVGPFGLAMDR